MITNYTAATLSMLSGVFLYYPLYTDVPGFTRSGYGLTLTIAGSLGIITWVLMIFGVRKFISQMETLVVEIQTHNEPPTPEQTNALHTAESKLIRASLFVVGLGVVVVLGMSVAQYIRL
ncbi:MAG: hypothetical protein FVQ83_06720 [Chloroflexi bacterium]|nr:hypothetical protein [Chloroflexota bacterium]